MTPAWPPYREPLLRTLLRTSLIALDIGALLAFWRGGLSHWPLATLEAFWPSFGGHWVEVFFLNVLRPRLPISRDLQIAARLALWFVAGILFVQAMRLTVVWFGGFSSEFGLVWWIGGLGFIVIELMAHVAFHGRGVPSFYDGRG